MFCVTTPVDKLTWKRERSQDFNLRQRTSGNQGTLRIGEITLHREETPVNYLIQVLGPKIIYIQVTLHGLSRLYLPAIKEKRVMNLRENKGYMEKLEEGDGEIM